MTINWSAPTNEILLQLAESLGQTNDIIFGIENTLTSWGKQISNSFNDMVANTAGDVAAGFLSMIPYVGAALGEFARVFVKTAIKSYLNLTYRRYGGYAL